MNIILFIRSRGLVHDGPNIKILSSEFNNNTADKGAGVFLYEGSNAVINNVTFTDNKVKIAGVFYNSRGSHVILNNSIFTSNNGQYDIYHESGNDLKINHVIINNNPVEISNIGCSNDYYRNQIKITN